MSSVHGQQTPWERAGVTLDEWRKALGRSINAWMEAASELDAWLAGGHSRSLEEWRTSSEAHAGAQREHDLVFRGDPEAVERFLSDEMARYDRRNR
jgi:hypothetical protein